MIPYGYFEKIKLLLLNIFSNENKDKWWLISFENLSLNSNMHILL